MANPFYGGSMYRPPSSPPSAPYRSFEDSYFGSRFDRFASEYSKYNAMDQAKSSYFSRSNPLGYRDDVGMPKADGPSPVDSFLSSLKRSSDMLYRPSTLGPQNAFESEAWSASNILGKRSRFENSSHLPVYPQRPGEKDCAHYMLTRTCKFGDSCKFDHPVWVPEGGIPDWKEVPLVATVDSLPVRPGEPDCPYFLKTQKCKYGVNCKFNHPKEMIASAVETSAVPSLPERPSEPPCAFYMKTGQCKFGASCKFHHPKDIQIPSAGEVNAEAQVSEAEKVEGSVPTQATQPHPVQPVPALFHNTKGLPVRPGETDCPFYMKTGSCKFGAICRFNHPDLNLNPLAAALTLPAVASAAASLGLGAVNPVASLYQALDPRLTQQAVGVGQATYPQRPGQPECDYYMKTGVCKFGERCKFNHPIDRSAPTGKQPQLPNVKLTLAGLPRREGAVHCPYYMKTGMCSFGANCKFDHPPPGEILASAGTQENPSAADLSAKEETSSPKQE